MSQTQSFCELNLHFYEKLKEKFLARARYHHFPEEIIEKSTVTELFSMVRDHEIELALLAESAAREAKAKLLNDSFVFSYALSEGARR